MNFLKNPLIRILLVAAGLGMILYLPTREFLKTTFILGIPFIVIMGYMRKRVKYSLPWIISLLMLIGVCGAYIFFLADLPQRVEARRIIMEGGLLVSEGKYEQAIEKYQGLEELDRSGKMDKKINEARNEAKGAELLQEARQLYKDGKLKEARRLLDKIPPNTRAAVEAARMLKNFEK